MNRWIEWSKEIRALGQIGKTYAEDPYDLERYERLTGIAHEMMAALADAPVERVENFFVPDRGYATPKVDLRAGVFDGGKVLLVRERADDRWSLPGGWADVGESPRLGIAREVLEETGYRVEAARLVAVRDRSLHDYRPVYPEHIYKLLFLCEIVDRVPAEMEDIGIAEVGFFDPGALPPLSTSRVLPRDVELLHRHLLDPGAATTCD